MKNKYRNCKVTTQEGITFDSRKEYFEYLRLFQLQQDGQIKNLQRQVKYELVPKQTLNHPVKEKERNIKTLSAVTYSADFVYEDLEGNTHVIDTKSPATKTPVYQVKKKLMKYRYNIEIEEV